jgi:hypothetical protein
MAAGGEGRMAAGGELTTAAGGELMTAAGGEVTTAAGGELTTAAGGELMMAAGGEEMTAAGGDCGTMTAAGRAAARSGASVLLQLSRSWLTSIPSLINHPPPCAGTHPAAASSWGTRRSRWG